MTKAMLLMVAVAACKPQQPQQPPQHTQVEPCDGRVEDRRRWFTTPQEAYDGRRPSDGFDVLGTCADRIVDGQPSCDKDELRGSVGHRPHLHDALALGFKTYVCELASDHSRTEYPLADLLTKRSNETRPVAPARSADRVIIEEALAKLEGFKNDMCKCVAGDKSCAEKVEKEMKDFMESMKGKEPNPKSISRADEQKLMSLMSEMVKCQMSAMGTDGTGAP